MAATAEAFSRAISAALGDADAGIAVFTGLGGLPSAFPVTDFAAGSIAAAGLALARLVGAGSGTPPTVTVDRRLASLWFGASIRPVGWGLPAPWDPVAGDYRTRDGWIRLHTNALHHRRAAERILGPQGDRDGMAAAVAGWDKGALEAAIVAEGGCAAEMRTAAEWLAHPQGMAVAAEPLVALTEAGGDTPSGWRPQPGRPLAGLRVLDLTRVLAGPVATRFLAGYGAAVLRIDPPDWHEPGLEPDVTLGKRCARLDLRRAEDRATFEALLGAADLLLHGYRPDALDRLGYGAAARRALAPGLIDVCLDAYGWSGPWAGRRGFDSLVQMSSGIARAGQDWRGADGPVPLPVQALDHATGYILAATAIHLTHDRLKTGRAGSARLSLARTAKLLLDAGRAEAGADLAPDIGSDAASGLEPTAWGAARRLRPPLAVDGAAMRWDLPARRLGSDSAIWP
ncbi:CoA transferase [uncultured Methylobacterium sp.]|uniref:CoA transferase n=1 Tax=uncultured Methylobacterium sp. TaxID=157278 RepID=UPI0035CC17A1